MRHRAILRVAAVLAALTAMLSFVCALEAGTSGKLSGRVIDNQGQPVFVANVLLVGTKLGANTDEEGYFSVINIPAGTYQVRISHVAYQQMLFSNITISADQTTKLDAKLVPATATLQTVEVRAERPVVDVNLTSTRATVTSKDIEALPLQELQDVVNLQAGVVDGHVRGGRIGEVQYQVDGVSVNNPYDNKSTLKIDRSLLQEVQVISGVFDAEYGQAMSGVVNAVLKDGTDRFHWNAEFSGGGFVFPEANGRLVNDKTQPRSIGNAQLSLSGPIGLPKTVYLLNARGYRFDDYVQAERRFVPTSQSGAGEGLIVRLGDGRKEALGFSREYSGLLKITNKSIPNVAISYQAVFNDIHGRRTNWAYRLNPDGLTKQTTYSVNHGFDWTHTLSPKTYYKLSLRQNWFEYWDRLYTSLWDPRYRLYGQPFQDPAGVYEPGAILGGVDLTRFGQRTNEALVAGSFVSQVNRTNLVKVGGEYHRPHVSFGPLGYLVYSTGQLVIHRAEPPNYPGAKAYDPVIAAAYAQDQIEWRDLTVRAGLRFDYFSARDSVPSDLENPANSITGAPASPLRPTTAKTSVSPRLGVAIPISVNAGLHFAYGHFYQFPSIGTVFTNADYRILNDLAASSIDYGVLGNPDIKPEHTVQYEMGYKHAITPDLGVDLNMFYKDIRNLIGVEFVSTYNDAEYARLTNVDFGDVIGFTLTVNDRKLGPLDVSADYTWQKADGNSSDPNETSVRAQAGEDPRPRLVPFNWDQRHTFNATVSTVFPREISASFILRVASGQPYTPVTSTGFGHGLEENSGRKPMSTLVDLRAEKNFIMSGYNVGFFGRVFNILDTRYFNGQVFDTTGSPYYSRASGDKISLGDPTRFYAPRRIEVGVKLEPGS